MKTGSYFALLAGLMFAAFVSSEVGAFFLRKTAPIYLPSNAYTMGVSADRAQNIVKGVPIPELHVFFANGSSELSPDQESAIAYFVRQLSCVRRVSLAGWASGAAYRHDNDGARNLQLARMRVGSVSRELRKSGIELDPEVRGWKDFMEMAGARQPDDRRKGATTANPSERFTRRVDMSAAGCA